jgi:mannosyltransferase OCH1-like enzyme
MSGLDFWDFDKYLLGQKGRIIHQIWVYGIIPSRRETMKQYKKLKIYRDSWKIKNPTWCHIEWNKEMCNDLMKNIYPEHMEMYKKYTYEIQRCDAIRYFILYRYGGWYADMDYYCNRPVDEALKEYQGDILLTQTPNTVIGQNEDHVSNSLIYSIPNQPFWRQFMLDLERNQKMPYYYSKHITVMFTTGPGILNRVYSRYKYKYKIKSLPWKLFHPYGIKDDIRSVNLSPDIFTAHVSKGLWSGKDTLFFNTIIRDWKLLLFIIIVLLIPIIFLFRS